MSKCARCGREVKRKLIKYYVYKYKEPPIYHFIIGERGEGREYRKKLKNEK